ncbi:MAG: hypothetical protein K8S55_07260 [Phycisphaerae bacterium]|nr:hypothetical protein [Phycisphaerae bacterium]
MNACELEKLLKRNWKWLGGLAILLGATWLANELAPAAEPTTSTDVFYQVTYTDRTIKNLPEAPRTNVGVMMVTRVAHFTSSAPQYNTVSTGNAPLEVLNPSRTVSTKLKWDGKAWVAAVKAPPTRQKAPAAGPAPPADIATELQKIRQAVAAAEKAIALADKALSTSASNPAALTNAREALADAKKSLATVRQQIQTVAAKVNTPSRAPGPPAGPPATLSTDLHVEGYGGWGRRRWGWGCGNVSIHKEEPNPDYDTGPRVIIRRDE